MSASEVRRIASSKAKLGAPDTDIGFWAISWIQLAGLDRNASGLVSTALHPVTSGEQTPMIRPMSWKNGSHDTTVVSSVTMPPYSTK